MTKKIKFLAKMRYLCSENDNNGPQYPTMKDCAKGAILKFRKLNKLINYFVIHLL